MSAETLLPCPFCGEKARTFDYNGSAHVTCAREFEHCAGTDVVAPVAMWNLRTPPAPMEAVAWGSCKTCNSERPSSPCWKCGGAVDPVAAGWEWPGLNDICRIRELAREVGYAVGVHGSMQRDQDLIAVPWVADAVGPLALAQHIAAGLGGQVMDYQTQDKPCGRWSCNIHTPDWTKLIDLSVMPPAHPPQPDALPGDLRERVAQIIEAAIERHNPGKSLRHTVDDADAILSLIQSERGGA